jgi:spermidine synthase
VISHGIQFTDPKLRNGHFSYYSETSGIGMAINNLQPGPRQVGILGLGVGALASYARAGDTFRFYEIAPLIEKVARREFTYLADCRGTVDVVLGDGRLSIEQEPDSKFDILIMDAFSSDSIPVHLVTLEALTLYFAKLKPDGILAIHISNRHLNLAPVLLRASAELNAQFVLIEAESDRSREIYVTDWVLMTKERDLRKIPEIKKAALKLELKDGIRLWTDDYSNLIQILK